MFLRLEFPKNIIASQTCPSSISPSPIMQIILLYLSFSPVAAPTACEIPWPKDPEVFSIPGRDLYIGCPSNLELISLKPVSSLTEKKPLTASVAYHTGQMCPFDK